MVRLLILVVAVAWLNAVAGFSRPTPLPTSAGNVITTFAGTLGASGSTGDGGPATAATLSSTTGVAVDTSSNVYVSDKDNDYVRMIASATGIIRAYAGTGGVFGRTGDGLAATVASLGAPGGLALDALGNLYIADGFNGINEVRVVMKDTGIINLVAGTGDAGYSGDGGAATDAQLNGPQGVVVDTSGNVYIADTANNRVRLVTQSTGIITTAAGTGESDFTGNNGPATGATLNRPHGLAIDTSGNLYIADEGNLAVRMVSAATGIITTFAGTGTFGTEGMEGDGGPATSAELNPTGVAVDALNNVFIADSGGNRIRLVTATTGIITTVVGTGTAGDSGDGGPATSAQISSPWGLAIDPYRGVLYVTDSYYVRSITYAFPCPPGTTSATGNSPCAAMVPTEMPTGQPTREPTIGYEVPVTPTANPTVAVPTSYWYTQFPTPTPTVARAPTAPTSAPSRTRTPTHASRAPVPTWYTPWPTLTPTGAPTVAASSSRYTPWPSPTPTGAPAVAAVPTAAHTPSPPTGSGKAHPTTSSSGHKPGGSSGSSSHHHHGSSSSSSGHGVTTSKSMRSHNQAGHVTVDVGVDIGITIKK